MVNKNLNLTCDGHTHTNGGTIYDVEFFPGMARPNCPMPDPSDPSDPGSGTTEVQDASTITFTQNIYSAYEVGNKKYQNGQIILAREGQTIEDFLVETFSLTGEPEIQEGTYDFTQQTYNCSYPSKLQEFAEVPSKDSAKYTDSSTIALKEYKFSLKKPFYFQYGTVIEGKWDRSKVNPDVKYYIQIDNKDKTDITDTLKNEQSYIYESIKDETVTIRIEICGYPASSSGQPITSFEIEKIIEPTDFNPPIEKEVDLVYQYAQTTAYPDSENLGFKYLISTIELNKEYSLAIPKDTKYFQLLIREQKSPIKLIVRNEGKQEYDIKNYIFIRCKKLSQNGSVQEIIGINETSSKYLCYRSNSSFTSEAKIYIEIQGEQNNG